MKNYFLIFEDCCFYEIVILSYFFKCTDRVVEFCSINGKNITCMEGFTVEANIALENINVNNVESFILPGGIVTNVISEEVMGLLHKLKKNEKLIAAICAGVDVLAEAGLLENVRSIHSEDVDCIYDKNIITARANAYVDFAIEVAKKMDLFEDEADLEETIDFWKYHKRM